eukprot:5881334-Pleurochrysis_carterae.AAC.1
MATASIMDGMELHRLALFMKSTPLAGCARACARAGARACAHMRVRRERARLHRVADLGDVVLRDGLEQVAVGASLYARVENLDVLVGRERDHLDLLAK